MCCDEEAQYCCDSVGECWAEDMAPKGALWWFWDDEETVDETAAPELAKKALWWFWDDEETVEETDVTAAKTVLADFCDAESGWCMNLDTGYAYAGDMTAWCQFVMPDFVTFTCCDEVNQVCVDESGEIWMI